MTTETYTLSILTPCFCAGANQAVAEIRPSAIRGQLRWWFRALGGDRNAEREIFGGIAKKEEDIRSSAIIVRTSNFKGGVMWQPPRVDPNSPSSYVWFFASRSADGIRWTSEAVISPGSSFTLQIIRRRAFDSPRFEQALTCFLALGGIGLRVTRGLGAFHCLEKPFDLQTVGPILQAAGFAIEDRGNTGSLDATVKMIGSLVKGTRKDKGWRNDMKHGNETRSPMGTSIERQTSAIYFRPVKDGAGLRLIVFEAPHERVLGPTSRRPVSTVGRSPSQLVETQLERRRQ